jgi:hypothetical protein
MVTVGASLQIVGVIVILFRVHVVRMRGVHRRLLTLLLVVAEELGDRRVVLLNSGYNDGSLQS